MAKTIFNQTFMNTKALLSAVLALPLLTGCAVPLNKSIMQPQATVPASHKVTIAVLPFETIEQPVDPADEDKNRPQESFDQNVRNFEKKFFAARLVETLAKSPWVKEAHVSPVITPSVDYLVRGGIIESDGEDTTVSITVSRCCWQDVHTETFSMALASSHLGNGRSRVSALDRPGQQDRRNTRQGYPRAAADHRAGEDIGLFGDRHRQNCSGAGFTQGSKDSADGCRLGAA